MDLVARMNRLPRPGETVTGESFLSVPGGKGANQAVAASRLGADVVFIGRVGDDAFGASLRQLLVAAGVDTSLVSDTQDCCSGVALIGVDVNGANAITVIPGANGRLTEADIESSAEMIASADAVVLQLETPIDTVAAAIRIARRHQVITILDPAPAPAGPLPPLLMSVDIISPNQTEAEAITGIAVVDLASATEAARAMQRNGAKQVVLKLGELGALVLTQDGTVHQIPAITAMVVDTTAAGDAFTAALAVAICEGHSLEVAARWGTWAGTIACTRFGAQPSMPTRLDVEQFGAEHGLRFTL